MKKREMQKYNHWVCWDNEKVPIDPKTGKNAKSNDASTWSDVKTAKAYAEVNENIAGIGFVFTPNDPYCGIDLDHAFINDIQELHPWAVDFLDRLGGSYTEISPSGSGLHVIVKDRERPDWWRDCKDTPEGEPAIEVYSQSRYFTMTGKVFNGQTQITCGDEWEDLLRDYMPADELPPIDHEGDAPSVYELLDQSDYPPGQHRSHPYHNSETGKNFKVDEDGKTFRCYRHEITGNIYHLLGIREGIIECGEWQSKKLSKDQWRQIFDAARKEDIAVPESESQSNPIVHYLPDGETIESAKVKHLAFASAEYLSHSNKFLAVLNDYDADLFVYSDGIWKPRGDQGVREILRPHLREKYTTHLRREVVDQLKGINPVERDTMGVPVNTVAVKNGLLNLDTRELRPLRPEDRALWKMNTAYDPEASCDLWRQTLQEIVHPDYAEKYILTIQEFFGSMLSFRLIPMKQHLFILGPADAGKSILVLVPKAMFGDENVATESIYALCNTRWGVASLYGKPLNVRNDLDANIIKNAARWKELTSPDDPIAAERKNQNKFSFTPHTKFLFTANQAPKSNEADQAFWIRFITMVFPRTIPEAEQDKQLLAKLTTEEQQSGILNWMLDGLDRLREQKQFTYQPSPDETIQIWTSYGGSVERFIDAELILTGDKNDFEKKSDVYGVYRQFALQENKQIEEQQQFTTILKSRGYVDTGQNRFNGRREETYQGLRFKHRGQHSSPETAWEWTE